MSHQESVPVEFVGGYPTPATAQRLYDEADLNRAIQAYRFFFPNVSMLGLFNGFEPVGTKENEAFVVVPLHAWDLRGARGDPPRSRDVDRGFLSSFARCGAVVSALASASRLSQSVG
jgi:hypothetical protein